MCSCKLCSKSILTNQFCSKSCRAKYFIIKNRKKELTFNCEICRRALSEKQSKTRNRFCSIACSSKRINRRKFSKKVLLECFICKKNFYRLKSKIVSEHVFCSKKCSHKSFIKSNYDYSIFFNNSEFRSYFLGLFVSDGNLSRNTIRISLIDYQLIKDLHDLLKLKNPIGNNKQQNPNAKMQYSISFSGIIPQKIKDLGYPSGPKTGKEFIPNCVNDKETFKHFLRGFLDGDGSYFLKNNNLHCKFVSMNYSFLEDIYHRLLSFGIVHGGSLSSSRYIPTLYFAHEDSINIGNFIYESCNLKLNRKYEVYNKMKDIILSSQIQKNRTCSICGNKAKSRGFCTLHYQQFYKQNNKEKVYLYNKKYRELNKEKLKEQLRLYYINNKEKYKAYGKKQNA